MRSPIDVHVTLLYPDVLRIVQVLFAQVYADLCRSTQVTSSLRASACISTGASPFLDNRSDNTQVYSALIKWSARSFHLVTSPCLFFPVYITISRVELGYSFAVTGLLRSSAVLLQVCEDLFKPISTAELKRGGVEGRAGEWRRVA